MKKGDSCTVSQHYGHTDTERVFVIEEVISDHHYKSGIAVRVNGLPLAIDSRLINLVEPIKFTVKKKIEYYRQILKMKRYYSAPQSEIKLIKNFIEDLQSLEL